MGCNGGTFAGRHDAAGRFAAFGVAPLLITAACSFNTQPIFESRADPSQIDDLSAGTDFEPSLEVDASTPIAAAVVDAAAASPPPAPMCKASEVTCRDPNTLASCGADGQSLTLETCASGCNTRGAQSVCNVCTPGEVQGCASAAQVKRCKADGSGSESVRCPNGCNAGTCAGSCVPGATSCADPMTLRTCDSQGGSVDRACALGCTAAASGAACNVCMPSTATCRGQDSLLCDANGQIGSNVACVRGCDSATGHCVPTRILPLNLPATTCEEQASDDLMLMAATTLDTDTGCSDVVDQAGGAPAICVVRRRDIRVGSGVVVKVTGSRALALVATRNLRIEGEITVAAHLGMAGPGALVNGTGVGRDATALPVAAMQPIAIDAPANAGGGGGGHAVRGGSGGDAPGECTANVLCANPGAGGAAYGTERSEPLQGGARGGHNSASSMSSRRGTPGAGGGAIQIVACEELTLGAQAVIDASGGGGGGGQPGSTDSENETPGAGTGGGSGGAIVLEAQRVSVQAGAILVANGGGGGGGATRARSSSGPGGGMGMGMGSGPSPAAPGGAGQDGRRSAMAAAGGPAGGAGSMPGGAGGALNSPANGGSAVQEWGAAGGGGGAAGRIRINSGSAAVDTNGAVISPRPSMGMVETG